MDELDRERSAWKIELSRAWGGDELCAQIRGVLLHVIVLCPPDVTELGAFTEKDWAAERRVRLRGSMICSD